MKIPDGIHDFACIIEQAAITDPKNTAAHGYSYWLALACSLLTSPRKEDRENGKKMVRRWKHSNKF